MKKKLMKSRDIVKALRKCAEPADNEIYMTNRNPRNLEMMKISYRPTGFGLDVPGHSFWHKLVVEKTPKNFTAKVQHYTGRTVLECSTDEWSLAKQLYRPYDMSAYITFGRIFAQRCLESGIIEIENFNNAEEGGKLDTFLKELEKNGLKLKETPRYVKRYAADAERNEKPWMIQND